MRIGIIGAGNIGGELARLWSDAGHRVMLSFTRDQGRLSERAQGIGPGVSAGTPREAAEFADVVVLCVPWPQVPDALMQCGDLGGRIVIDTCNPFVRPGERAALPQGTVNATQTVERLAPGARVVKAFNTLYWVTLGEQANRKEPRLGLPISGDDPDGKATVAGLVRDAGYDPVDIGSLNGAGRQEPGGPLYGDELTAADIAARLRTLESTHLSLARRFIGEVLGGENPAAMAELVSADVQVNSGLRPLTPIVGIDEFADALGDLAAFTFVDFVVEDLLAVEDRVVARYRAHADHTGDQLGIPATNQRITMWEIRLMRWRDSMLIEDYVADINYDWPWLVAAAYPDGVGRTGLT